MSDARYLLVLDEGTTSTRAILYAPGGDVIATAQEAITQHYPAPGLVEHDATELWERTLRCARAMVERAGGADRIEAIGVTNQRETVVAWDRTTGQPWCRIQADSRKAVPARRAWAIDWRSVRWKAGWCGT